jgi:ABC-type glycerol-3-phosphate transport system substrate-binding protein
MGYKNWLNAEDEKDWIRIVKGFEKLNPGVRIKYEMTAHKDYRKESQKRINSDNIPDAAFIGIDYLMGEPWKEAGQLVWMLYQLEEQTPGYGIPAFCPVLSAGFQETLHGSQILLQGGSDLRILLS